RLADASAGASPGTGSGSAPGSPDDDGAPAAVDLGTVLVEDGGHRRRLLAVLGASSALGDMLVSRPTDVALLSDRPREVPVLDLLPADERERALRAVGADPEAAAPVATIAGRAGVDAM